MIANRLTLLLFLVLCGYPSTVGAGTSESYSVQELFAAIEARTAVIASFSADFVQTRTLSIFPQPVIFSGRLTVLKPGRLRWEFTQPLSSALLLNGRTGYRCSAGAPKKTFNLDHDPVMAVVARQLLSWTAGSYRELADMFTFTTTEGPGLLMTARATSFISRIKVLFDPETLQPLTVEIFEPGGDETLVSFANYHLNPALPDDFFSSCPE